MAHMHRRNNSGSGIGSEEADREVARGSKSGGRIQNRRILDVGTGTGRAAILFARGGANVTAVDASAQMLEVARARAIADDLQNITFGIGDVHALDGPRHKSRAISIGLVLNELPVVARVFMPP